MNLYEIDQRLLNLETYGVDTETGEVAVSEEDFQRMYEDIQMDMENKLINTACYIKNVQSDIEQIKAEEDRLKKRRQSKEKAVERYKKAMDNVIKHRLNDIDNDFDGCNKWKIDDPKAIISYRKSTRLEILDADLIPKKYKTKEVVTKISTEDITKALKNGEKVKGAELVRNLNMQIR